MTTAALSSDAARSASGSSFYFAMRILPRRQRDAMFEIYRYCRSVDDIADSRGPREGRLAELNLYRDDVQALYSGRTPARLAGFTAAISDFGLRKIDFMAVIDGMEMDVVQDIRAPDLNTLDLYCDLVASAVGRLSVKVFGMPDADGIALSHHLGRALQLTNILRDLDEDAAIGRLYLPREYLSAADIRTNDPEQVLASPNLTKACTLVIDTAGEHFRKARAIMDRQPRATVKAPRIMAEAYMPMLERLKARGFAAPRQRVRPSRARLAWAVLRYALI
jgi:phytoene synthase